MLNRNFALNADTGKATILVADDNEANREILSDLLTGEGHSIICTEDGDQALRIIRDGSMDMALLDVMMPGKSGFAVCHAIKSEPETRFIPVVFVTGLSSVDERIQGINSGADDFLSKPVNRHELLARVRSLLRLKAYTDELENAETVLFSLALSIEAKDPYTRGHCDRLATYSLAMAQRLGLTEQQCMALRRAGIVHDIGKIGVPEHIIVKTGPLTGEERSIMEQHPVTGERICALLKSFRLVLPIIRHHHEKLDGTGYPDGLRGDRIPLTARVLQITDIYDELTTDRPYRRAMQPEDAIAAMRNEVKRGWWDGSLVDELQAFVINLKPNLMHSRRQELGSNSSSKEFYVSHQSRPTHDRGVFIGAILLLACAGLTIHAQGGQASSQTTQYLNGLSLAQLANIEVTIASKEPEPIWQTPAAIYVITQDDIRRSGATTIPELLRDVPGVEVARIDSDHWAVGVRGFGGEFSKSLLVLIDGRSVYSPLFAGVYWQVQDTLFEDIDRIEVIRGPGGTIWGANAVNGIINIITKNAKDTHGQLYSLGGGNVDQGIGGARFGGASGRDFEYRVYGKGFTRGPESHPDGENFDEWRMGQLGFRTDWEVTHRDTLDVQGDMYKGRDGERVAISSYSPPTLAVVNASHSTSGGNITASWRRKIGDHSDIETRGYFDRTTRFSPQLNETRNTFDIDLLYHLAIKGRQDLLLGIGARWSPDSITQKYATLDFEPHQETDSIYSWFIQDQIAIVPGKFSLTLGSKFEHNNRSGFELQPNGRLLWAPTLHQTLWGAVTRAVRTPSRLDQDLQLTDFLRASPPTFLRVIGSKNFKSERLVGTEVGYRTLVGNKLYLDVSLFRNDYNDLYGYGPGALLLETSPAPARLVLQEPLANALKGDTSGGEIAPDWKPAHWLELKGSYSYLHLYVHDKPGFTDNQNTASDNGSSPHHQFVIQPVFNFPRRFEFDATYRYVSALPYQKIGAYQTGDVRLGWHTVHGWEFSVTGQNLLQPRHAEFGSDVNTIVGIKRDIYAKMTWTR